MKKILILCLLTSLTTIVSAHSGGTNSQGCHTNSKTGDYHCH
ncbi:MULTISPECIES: YHYH domain-containing protein [Acinetobacter]|nr:MULTISPECIES: YHYH domain-containing protein [Acinetobacter]